MSLGMQTKLLRILEDGELGAPAWGVRHVNVRGRPRIAT
jgi:hypothetical protein